MITAEYAQAEARRQAVASAKAHQVPFSPWPQDYDDPIRIAQGIPFLGDRKRIRDTSGPPLWVRADVREYLPDYPYKWFFVDSSGFGAPGEAALTLAKFVQFAHAYQNVATGRGFITGFGIVEVGQFQVHIAPYLRKFP